jgi:hypothetical protein
MNNHEAKFILGAYRTEGRDAGDPMFAEALEQAARDPELRAWLERDRKFDTVIAEKLGGIAPPAELKAAILAGGRASSPRRRWWRSPVWLAAAAVLVLAAIVNVSIKPTSGDADLSGLATFALMDIEQSHNEHVGYPEGLGAVQANLGSAALPLASAVAQHIDLDELQRKKCRSVKVGGREVFEICFQRDGTWFHLFAARRTDAPSNPADGSPTVLSKGEYAVATWADAKRVYALVGGSGEALRRLL